MDEFWEEEMRKFMREYFPDGLPPEKIQMILLSPVTLRGDDGFYLVDIRLYVVDDTVIPEDIIVKFSKIDKEYNVKAFEIIESERRVYKTSPMPLSAREYGAVFNNIDLEITIKTDTFEETKFAML